MKRETLDHSAAESPTQVNLADLVDDLGAVVWEADPRTFDFVFVNRRGVELFGYPRDEWFEHAFWSDRLIYEPDRRQAVAICRRAVEERRDHQIEYRVRTADGRILWVRDFIRVLVDDDGSVRALRGMMLDVTAEKAIQAELDDERSQLVELAHEREVTLEALRSSESHYRRLVETSPFGVFVTDAEGNITEVNDAAARTVGLTPREVLGAHFAQFVLPEDLARAAAVFQAMLSGQGPAEWEVRVRRKDGAIRTLAFGGAPVLVDGVTVGVHGVARDVTDERAADARRRLLADALDNLPDAVSITDRQTRFLYVNRAHAELLGYDREHPPAFARDVMPDDEARAQIHEIYQSLERERRWSGRMKRLRSDGSTVLVSATIFAVDDGQDDYALTVMRDASVEITRDQHLRRVERLASLGTLIGGVAHELNNPLTAVVGFAHLMLLDERPAEDRETLETMAREAERAARIVADLRLVARNTQEEGGGEREAVDLNDIVRHVLRVRRYSLDTRNIRVELQLDDELPVLCANRAQMEQVVVNVIVNAEQALDRESQLERVITVRTRPLPAGVALHVADNGPGIRSDHLDRVFDPFFTTKPPGEGTGLGLSLVHSIVTEHGGTMRVDSRLGDGAEFVIELPVSATPTRPRESHARHTLADRALNVLVVDDEAAIRELLVRALTRRGHSVIEARDGAEALRVLGDLGARIDVIASDIRMPGLDGEQLLGRLRESRPDLAERVVFITGDAISGRVGALQEANMPVLLKPFQLDVAAALIESRAAPQDSTRTSG